VTQDFANNVSFLPMIEPRIQKVQFGKIWMQKYIMDPLNCAASLNNLGVTLLECKNTMAAIHAFQQAVNVMKEFTDSVVTTAQGVVGTTVANRKEPCAPATASPITDIHASLFQLQTGTNLESLNQGFYYAYDRPLLLPTNIVISACEDIDLHVFTASALIVFNFGMACHQLGKETGQESALRQAVQIYELALRMVYRHTGMNESISKVFMCLAWNNLASLHNDLCSYENCEGCLECVRNLLMYDSDIDLFALDFLDEFEWTELKLNLIYNLIPTTAQAA
jgi:hypothetical protein